MQQIQWSPDIQYGDLQLYGDMSIVRWKPPILIILVLEDKYKSPFSIDTKNVSVLFHFDGTMTF